MLNEAVLGPQDKRVLLCPLNATSVSYPVVMTRNVCRRCRVSWGLGLGQDRMGQDRTALDREPDPLGRRSRG